MCVVPCASETAAKASAVTEACNSMMCFGLNECVAEEKRKKNEKEEEKRRKG
jgi:hypothetical protein